MMEETNERLLLEGAGASGTGDLFKDIPRKLDRHLALSEGKSEPEVEREVREMLGKNRKVLSFLGGGAWNHYVPPAVGAITGRSEFYTAYTPYQPEISQGMLQSLFEYQSLICELTGMDVANSSMYDWASALGEAALMCARMTGKNEFIIPKLIHPDRRSTLLNYAKGAGLKIIEASYVPETGLLDTSSLSQKIFPNTCGIYIENPSYLGFFETQVKEISSIARDSGAKLVVGVDPISLGVAEAPGNYGADVVIGEGQPLGNPVSFGGPLLGIFAMKYDPIAIRKMPGRVIGATKSKSGRRAFCMTLMTREQAVKREKATSNICSNEALLSVATAAYLSLIGGSGLKKIGELCISNSKYAMKKIGAAGYESPIFNRSAHFKEFTVRAKKGDIEKLAATLAKNGIEAGIPLKKQFPELGETMLTCTTELHTKDDIDKLAEALKHV